jgi:PAS domain S-box-containing protein
MVMPGAAMDSALGRVVDAVPGLVWTAFPDGQIDFLNQRWSEYTGLGVDECRGRGWQAALHAEDLPRLLAGWRPDSASTAPVETQVRLRGPDGKYRWFLFRAHPSTDASGVVVKWSGLATDIDERRQAEEALRASERRFRLIVDGLPVLLSTATPDGELEQANRQYLEYFGASLEELKARETVHGLHPDDRARVLPVRQAAIEAGRPYQIECRRRRADGVYRWFYLRAFPLRDAEGRVVQWYRLQIDIEEQKRAEALLDGEKRLLEMVASGRPLSDILEVLCRLVESTVDGCYCSIVLLDPSGTKLQEAIAPSIPAEFNDAVRGWPLDRLGGPCQTAARDNTPVIMTDVASDTRWRNGWRALAQKHGLRSCWSTPIVSQAGKVLGTFALYQGEPGNPSALHLELIEQFTNIASIAIERAQRDTALRQSEARLAEAERELQLTLDTLPALVASYRPDGSRIFVNRTWLDYTGLSAERAIESERASLAPPEDAARIEQEWRTALAAGIPFESEIRLRRADGEYRWHTVRRVPARDETGAIVRWYSVAVDIEERKTAEEALRRSEARRAEAERELQLTIDSIPTLVGTYRPDGSRIFVNRTWRDYTGLTLETAREAERNGFVHPDDAIWVAPEWRKSLETGEPFQGEMRLRRADGEYRWHMVHRVAARDQSGAIVKWYSVGADIEERKQAEAALRESEARLSEAERELRVTLDTIPVMVWRGGANGYVKHLNKRWFEYTGTTPEQVRGRRWKQCVHPDDLERHVRTGTDYVAAGTPIDSEARLRRFDGEYRRFLFRPAPARDETGNIVAWYGTIIDIEDRKRAEEKVVEAERELQRTIDNIPVLVGTYSADGARLSANKRALEVTGLTAEDLPDERWRKAFHPDEVEAVESQWCACLANGEPFEREVRTRMADGTYRWHLTRRVPLRDEAGKIIRWYGISYDIEDRKRAEDELRRSEAFLAKAQRLSLTGSFSFYSATQEFIWSEELYRIFEFEPGVRVTLELIGSRYHPEDRHAMEEVAEGIRRGALGFDYEHRLLMPDGSIKHVHVVAHGTPDKEGTGLEYFGAVQDVTQRRHAEAELRRSEAYLAEAQRLSHTGSWAVDYANRKPIHSSEEHHRLFGFDPKNGMPPWRAWMDRIHPEDRARTREIIERSSREKTDLEMDYRICLPDGTVRYVHDVGHPVLNATGDVVEFVGTSVDVTQRRLTEDALDKVRSELAHVTRAMSLGALTASIAHEVNQPLAGIITNASTCLRMLAADPPNIAGARMTAQRTIRDGNRAADVISRLRALFSKKAPATEAVDLNEATREVLALVFNDLLRNRIALRVELDDEPLFVIGDRTQLQQVILNLVRNASDAMSEVNDRLRTLLVRADDADEDDFARVIVKDAGMGFDPQEVERLFEAFYTTKNDGMGIGLSVSRSIIESHGGKLWAEANDGPGATFLFSVPRVAGNATEHRTDEFVLAPEIKVERDARGH